MAKIYKSQSNVMVHETQAPTVGLGSVGKPIIWSRVYFQERL